jgi:hypothetical protein
MAKGFEVNSRYPVLPEKIGLLEAWKSMPPEFVGASEATN